MDIYLMLKAIIMGLVEGATEFIPVSSTGHLIIAGEWLNFLDKDKRDVFEIMIQLGAVLAVCVEFRQRLIQTVQRIQTDPDAQHLVRNLVIAFLPAAILGLAFHHQIKEFLFSSFTVGIALIVGGILILIIEKFVPPGKVQDIDHISLKQALQIGFAQSLALIPGVSRSGATILGGMCFGLSRQTATEFSFFLALPIMFAATGYDLLKARDLLSLDDAFIFLIGFVTAFLSALVVIRALIKFVSQHSFAVFAWYRIVFGILILLFFAH
ncbi:MULTISPECIES: undecaprenyl-diphosphate phosphatase [unclassified Methylophilus]|jgi:undecaprenyl-diphosphatase|uniref:undecaprenyl-diphosphate phosphatase n=1 Tax=unclassified Methylophilus TaxID=2630143 RepID=UPI0007003CDF|nr:MULTISPECIES: undecaprenyl-diphosphate phosphatase [unclassified Methylophilus]KQT41457.1 UDP-diphosphatase [Methylophilus sp. Leaf416]KQT57978.1 UDP-diphosphatase [Methylophilus sp. Leaf459]